MTPSYSGRDTGARDILHGEVQLEEHGDCIFYQGSKHKVHNITPMSDGIVTSRIHSAALGPVEISCHLHIVNN